MFELSKVTDPPRTKIMTAETKVAQDEAARVRRIIDDQSKYIGLTLSLSTLY